MSRLLQSLILFSKLAKNRHFMRFLFLVPVILFSISVRTQTVSPVVVSSNGGFSQQNSGSIAWTIGEPISETYTQTNNITTMGFHQPEVLDVIDYLNEGTTIGNLLVYPNPVKNSLLLDFKGVTTGDYSIQLTDMLGKVLYHREISVSLEANAIEVATGHFAQGSYLLQLKGKSVSKTIKIIKVN